MTSLNLSTNGPSISKSYQAVVNAPAPSGNASKSSTYGQWAVYSVSAPVANAFQPDAGGKESILKVQSTGEGELVDLIDEFSDGRIQFAFAKVKDPNTTLPKSVLIGWCGEGVPERTKGYFTSHLAAVSKVLHITARTDRDLTPESIVQKVSDASGSKYSGGGLPISSSGPPPPVSSKPAFTPTRSSAGSGGFNPLTGSRTRSNAPKDTNVDEDGWGQDAPQVTRTQLEKVQSSYQPTKVNMRELSSQKPEPSRFNGNSVHKDTGTDSDVTKGGYQPVGKVDIAALRRQAQQHSSADDRPTVVKGAYEPVGKVDIAAIRARAQGQSDSARPPPSSISPVVTGASGRSSNQDDEQKSLPDRSIPFSSSERLTSLPKPKVANRFGSSTGSFAGTKAPTPGGFGLESKATPAAPPVGVGRTFADQGGRTPAQIWAEKKARERGLSGASDNPPPVPMAGQTSGSNEWKTGYGGKSWAPVQTTRTGQSASSLDQQNTGQEDEAQEEAPSSSAGGIGALRDRFKGAPPMGASNVSTGSASSPPPLDTSSKPNAGRGIPLPGLPARPSQSQEEDETSRMPTPPPQPPRSPTPPTPPAMDSGSPIRVAMPVGRGHNDQEVEDAREEQFSPPPSMPARSLAQAIPHEDDLTDEPAGYDPARGAGAATAAATFGGEAAESAHPSAHRGGERALVQYDYEKAEENELELKEGEYVTNIEKVDEDWWMGQNPRGETGLFPSNYVEIVQDDEDVGGQLAYQAQQEPEPEPEPEPGQQHAGDVTQGHTATAIYDYEAAESNELSFPENAKITSVEFPDEDWWSGEYRGQQGLFPANYVQLDE
ncbi:drebrin-like protein, partial [Lecanoromycetidae sp. Uapishka_2]